ncbi:Microtubule-associated serine/threonine-protein kinase 2 [Tritrichomonas musculus]|uniref:non-specific serine/threonine protein kinase n=1 Tax=Tritrichomonas musculus TaxID=1915356 RepID=A0ABR2KRQ1_9EUKA
MEESVSSLVCSSMNLCQYSNSSFGCNTKNQSLFIFLKAQKTIINNAIKKIPSSQSPEEKRYFSTIRLEALRLTSCKYSELMSRIDHALSSLRKILSDNSISKSVEKTAQQLLTASISINRYIISNSIYPNFLHDISANNSLDSNADNQSILTLENNENLLKSNETSPITGSDENTDGKKVSANLHNKRQIPIPKNKNLMSYHSEPLSNLFNEMASSTDSSVLTDSKNSLSPNRSLNSQIPSFSAALLDCQEFVVCRICDEKIPAYMIDRHTVLCVKNYNNASFVTEVNKELQAIRDSISNNYLNIEWPGPSEKVLSKILLVFNILFILDNVITIEMNDQDSIDELNSSIAGLRDSKEIDSNTISEIQTIRSLICKKLCAAKASKINLERLRNTGATGISHVMKQALVSDFDFIKKISSGAYAKVFLGRKKKTGDIYAIKVIPRKGLTEKNQVKRLYAEKDILLRFSNPHIVSFCMLFILQLFSLSYFFSTKS